MIDRSFSVHIDRPPQEVFDYVTDPSKTGEWDPKVLSSRVEPPGKLAAGTKIVQKIRLGPGTVEGAFEIVGYEPGVEAVYRSDGSYFSGLVTFRVEAEGDGARFDVSEKGGSTGLLRLFESRLARSSGRQRETMMAIIKEKLEGQG